MFFSPLKIVNLDDDEPFLIYGQKSILYMIKVIKVIMHAISSGHAICIYVANRFVMSKTYTKGETVIKFPFPLWKI